MFVWVFLGFVVTSITITNIVIVSILVFSLFLLKDSVISAFSNALKTVAMILVSVLAYKAIMDFIYKLFIPNSSKPLEVTNWAVKYLREDGVFSGLLHMFASAKNAVLSAEVVTIPSRIKGGIYNFNFSLQGEVSAVEILISVSLVCLICLGAYKRANRYKNVVLASIFIICYNFVFHSFWGLETFLYSQHYQVFLLGLFCFAVVGWFPKSKVYVLWGCAILVAVNSVQKVAQILATLESSAL